MKDFYKQVSIYGILPVIGKFAGFFLVPIYARIFSSYEFGIIELIVTLLSFLMLASNLEFYGAIGRYFYEKETLKEKQILISTGLFLTIISTSIIIILSFFAEDYILNTYLDGHQYINIYRAGLVWLLFSALYTYLGVIPRYDHKPKLYVLINVSSLLIRILSTIIFVLILKIGIIGVIYGHIIGSFFSLIMNAIASFKYLGFNFNKQDAKNIFNFSVPLVPGLLLIGFWNPLSRNLISEYFSIATVGLFSFALRITSVMEIANSSIKMAWNPMLFENYKNHDFNKDLKRISNQIGIALFSAAICLTLISPEICLYIGTKEYLDSSIFIGFLACSGVFEILRKFRGFGPLIEKKTYILTINEVIGISIGFLILILFNNNLGYLGIGLAFIIPSIIKYIILIRYTSKVVKVNFNNNLEFLLISILIISIILVYLNTNIIIRLLIICFVGIVYLKLFLSKFKKKNL